MDEFDLPAPSAESAKARILGQQLRA